MVSSGEPLPTLNCNWKPLRPCEAVVTCAEMRASTTVRGAGAGTSEPTSRLRCTPLSTAGPREALGQCDPQPPADRLRQLLRAHGRVGVTDAPRELGISKLLEGDD